MIFLNPWLLAGIAAVGAPILIHMMMKRRVRRMKWAAMRFLRPVVQRNERKLRVEDLLLLLLRCLLIALLAIALARPAFRAGGMIPAGGGARTIVLAVDNSRSMGLTDGATSRFDNARSAARQIVDGLPAGSSAALLLFSDVARPLISEPATDLTLVKKMIGEATLTDRASNVHPALSEALDILQRHAAVGGQVYLITDAQATGWNELVAMRGEIAQANANVTVVVASPAEQPNLGVSALDLESPIMPVNAAARFSIQATNYGRDEARNVTVTLNVDGDAPCDQAAIASIHAGESRRVSLFARTAASGYHAVTASLPHDHLAADDRRTIVARAVDEIRVLLIAGELGATPREGDAFFLERALAPVAPEDRDSYYIKPRIVSPADLAGLKLADFDAIALIDVARLDPSTVTEIQDYVREGGGLMIFPGEQTDASFYNQAFGNTLLPAAFGAPWGDAAGKQRFRILQAASYTHPMVSIWQDPAAGTLSTARFYKGLDLHPIPAANNAAGDCVTILDYADASPAILERTWGNGRVIQFSSTANAAWNDLPAHPAFVPLMQRALGRLVTRRDEALNIPVGAPFTFPARTDWLYKSMSVLPPGSAPDAAKQSKVGLVNGVPLMRYEDTDMAGAYDVSIAADPAVKMRFAAQAAPAESTMDAIPDAQLRTLGSGVRVVHWTPGASLRQGLGAGGREFWTIFAALALAVACCESFLAGRFSAAK